MPQRIEVSAKPVDKPELVLPNIDIVNMRKIDWVLITPENFEEEVAKINQTGRPVVFFALTDQGYENLGMNFSDIRAMVQQQQEIIAAYENYYKNANDALDAANSNIEGAQKELDEQNEVDQDLPFWKRF